jgi:hypothetical protein
MTDRDLDKLLGPTGYEVTCEECFELLDEYVELELKGADADTRVPGCAPTSTAAPHAARNTRACTRSCLELTRRVDRQNGTRCCSGSCP